MSRGPDNKKRPPIVDADDVLDDNPPPRKKLDTTVKCPAPKAPPPNPCVGLGLSSSARIEEAVAGFKELKERWSILTPEQRRKEIDNIINSQLEKVGVPRVEIKPGSPVLGEGIFVPDDWEVEVKEAVVNSLTLTDEGYKVLAATIYHEARHAEQYYLIARKLAADGVDKIGAQASVPERVARGAKENPLKRDTGEYKCALALYESVSARGYVSRVHKELYQARENLAVKSEKLKAMRIELSAARERAGNARLIHSEVLRRFEKGEVTEQEVNKAKHSYLKELESIKRANNMLPILSEEVEEAKKFERPRYVAYKELVNEADAFDCEGRFRAKW